MNPLRRTGFRAGAAAGLGWLVLRVQPAAALPTDDDRERAHAAAVAAFTGGARLQPGRVRLTVSELVENGNLVPVVVQVESPMSTADHVQAIALFAGRNPLPEVAVFHLGPANGAVEGRVQVATRMRLATSQTVTAVAKMNDGRCHAAAVDVIVTLAACVES